MQERRMTSAIMHIMVHVTAVDTMLFSLKKRCCKWGEYPFEKVLKLHWLYAKGYSSTGKTGDKANIQGDKAVTMKGGKSCIF
jgi:hypothetical protein